MANLSETAAWEAGVYQIETTDPVLGGAPNPATGAGMSNIPHLQLAQRTLWLKDQVDTLVLALNSLDAELDLLASYRTVVAPVLAATTANIALSGLQMIDGVSVTAGRRVLVKNQSTAAQNGVYIAATGVWQRAADFNDDTDILPGTLVAVTSGTAQADTLWTLSSPQEGAAITVGSTAVTFANVTALMAPLASPALTGAPTGPTPAQFNSSGLLATTEFVQRALGNHSNVVLLTGNVTLTAADAGKCYVIEGATAITVTLPSLAATANGAAFEFVNSGANDLTVQRAGADQIDLGPSAALTVVVPPNQSLRLIRAQSAAIWHAVGITAQALSSTLGSQLVGAGWQRLPSGLILQWVPFTTSAGGDTSVTLPIAFPTNCVARIATARNSPSSTATIASIGSNTLSSIAVSAWNTSGARIVHVVDVFAIGY